MTTMQASPRLATRAKYHTSADRGWADLGSSCVQNEIVTNPHLAQALRVYVAIGGACYGIANSGTGVSNDVAAQRRMLSEVRHTHLLPAPSAKFSSPAQAVEYVRTTFDLNVKQLADILKIERVTVYDWLRKNAWEKLHPARQKRLLDVASIAAQWAKRPQIPPGYLLEPLDPSGETLLKLLSRDHLPTAEILIAYTQLLQNKSLEQRVSDFSAARGQQTRVALSTALSKVKDMGIE